MSVKKINILYRIYVEIMSCVFLYAQIVLVRAKFVFSLFENFGVQTGLSKEYTVSLKLNMVLFFIDSSVVGTLGTWYFEPY